MEEKPPEDVESQVASRGLFLTDGMSLRLSNLKFVVEADGRFVIPPATVELSLNMCPNWFGISVEHVRDAQRHHETLKQNLEPRNEPELGRAMEKECRSAMQAIAAAAFAMDAMYSSVKLELPNAAELTRKWTVAKTARYKQVAEVFRQVFDVRDDSFAKLRNVLKLLFEYRGWAVHPPSHFSTPQFYAVIESVTEWRYVAFCYNNAYQLVRGSLGFTKVLLTKETRDKVSENQKGLSARLLPLWADWERDFGPLIDQHSD